MDDLTPDPRLVTSKDRAVLIQQAYVTLDHLLPMCVKVADAMIDLAQLKMSAITEYTSTHKRNFLEYEANEFQTTAAALHKCMRILKSEVKSWESDPVRMVSAQTIEVNIINEIHLHLLAGQMVITSVLGTTYVSEQLLDLITDSLKKINSLIL